MGSFDTSHSFLFIFAGEKPKSILNDKKIIVFFIYLTMGINILFAQDIESNIKERLTDYFNKYTATAKISTPKLNSFDIDYDRKTIAVYASESFAYQPFRSETVETIYNQVKIYFPVRFITTSSLFMQTASRLKI